MTVLPSPEAMIVICTVILIAYTAHVVDKAFASSEQFEALLSARDRIIGLQAENAKLRELVRRMARALRVGSEWCDRDCEREFDCNWMDKCPVESAMKELGVEVDG